MKVENIDGEVVVHLGRIELDALVKTLNYVLNEEEPHVLEEEWDVLVTLRDKSKEINLARTGKEKRKKRLIDKKIFIDRLRDIISTLRKEKFKGPEQSLSAFESGNNCGIDDAIGEIEDLIDEIPNWK